MMSSNLNYYNTDIFFDNNGQLLRSGMNCTVNIVIEEHLDVVYVPVSAAIRINGNPSVYVMESRTYKPRKITIGLDNDKMVHVLSGLRSGEKILLNPPLSAGAIEDAFIGDFLKPGFPGNEPFSENVKAKGAH